MPRVSRMMYTMEEDTKIVQYIIAKKMYSNLRGNLSWKLMEKDEVCPGRSWQSLKERFRRYIIHKLFKLKISPEEKTKVYNRYHNSYGDKKQNSNNKDTNENYDISEESDNDNINTKRKRSRDQLEDCDVNNSSLKCIKTLKSKTTVTENNEGNDNEVRNYPKKALRYTMRITNQREDNSCQKLEKAAKFSTEINENNIQKNIEDHDDTNTRNLLKKKMSYMWDTPYSAEEDKQIVLFFKRNIGSLRSISVYETLREECGLRRTPNSLRRRFIEVILPELHKFKELTYLEMVSICDSAGLKVSAEIQELINLDVESRSSQSTLDELDILNRVNKDIVQISKESEIKQKCSNFKTFEKEVVPSINQNGRLQSMSCDLILPPANSVTDNLLVKNVDEEDNSESSLVSETETLAKVIPVAVAHDYDSFTSNPESYNNNKLSVMTKYFDNVQHAFVMNRNFDFPRLQAYLRAKHGILPENIHIVDQEFFATFLMCAQAKVDFKKEIASIFKLMFRKDIPVNNAKLIFKNNVVLCCRRKLLCEKQSYSCTKPNKIPSTNPILPEARITLDEIVLHVSNTKEKFSNRVVHNNNSNTSQSDCSIINQIDPNDKKLELSNHLNKLGENSSQDCQNNSASSEMSQIIEPYCNQDNINELNLESTEINELNFASTQINKLDLESTKSNQLDPESTQNKECDPVSTQSIECDFVSKKINELDLERTQYNLNNQTPSKAIEIKSKNEAKVQNITETNIRSKQDDTNNQTSFLTCNKSIVSNELNLGSTQETLLTCNENISNEMDLQDDLTNRTPTKINQDTMENISLNEMDLGPTQETLLTCNENISNEMDLQDDLTNRTPTKINQDTMQNISLNEMDLGSTHDHTYTQTSFLTCNQSICSAETDLGQDLANRTPKINQDNIQNISVHEMFLGSAQDHTYSQTSFLTCHQSIGSVEIDLGQDDLRNRTPTKIHQDNIQNICVNEMNFGLTQDHTYSQTSFVTCSAEMDLGFTQDDTNNCFSPKASHIDLGLIHDHTYTESSFSTSSQSIFSNEMDLGTRDDAKNHASLKASEVDLGSKDDGSTNSPNILNFSINDMNLGVTQGDTKKPLSQTNQMNENAIVKSGNDKMYLDSSEAVQNKQTAEINTQENDPNVVPGEIVKFKHFYFGRNHS